jgi:hypothetical protein
MSTQSIRPSQFITTYGPGAIIEGKNGPRLIPRADIGLFSDRTINVEDFEISDSRMSEGILKKAMNKFLFTEQGLFLIGIYVLTQVNTLEEK